MYGKFAGRIPQSALPGNIPEEIKILQPKTVNYGDPIIPLEAILLIIVQITDEYL